ncbi:MAG TPA: fatty acid desaturase [Lentisphaeria bacterium]|nr:MAG: fatty acid desaturase [Lentisphaerae bacterium GWF2_50_93]HCE47034.1 fatty acid desaturase [Lentisphaeria bacterium]
MAVTETASSNKAQDEQSPSREWPAWHASLSKYRDPSAAKSIWQLINTMIPYFVLWFLMIMSIRRGYPYALTLALAALAAAFLVRIFILFHDCVHGSFFRKKGPNTFFGHLLGLMVFTPFDDWRFSHLRHHASYADLDARGFGDIWTMTLAEYHAASKWKRTCYRLYRNPVVLVGMGALFSFLLRYRLPARKSMRKERASVIFTDLLIVGIVMTAAWSIGWRTYVLIQLPVIWMAGAAGIWLFYVQHQFDGVYWSRKKDWDAMRAAMEGSSFYKLPAVMRWFSGSIGYHHVHHLGSRIPNYRLKECYDAIPALRSRAPLTFWKSLSAIRLKVWDEEQKRLVGFR